MKIIPSKATFYFQNFLLFDRILLKFSCFCEASFSLLSSKELSLKLRSEKVFVYIGNLRLIMIKVEQMNVTFKQKRPYINPIQF